MIRALPFAVLVLLPLARAQDTAPLPPAQRYVDTERSEREARFEAESTARLGPSMDYRMEFDVDKNLIHVELKTRVQAAGKLCLVMPAWSPGSYRIVNNGRRVQELRVKDAKGDVEVAHPDDNVWTCAKVAPGPLQVTWDLELGRFAQGRGGNRDGAPAKASWQFDGPRVWLHEVRHKGLPCTVELVVPNDWDVATGLAPKGKDRGRAAPGRWRFTAPDYDNLADCPVKLGEFERFETTAGKLPFEIALSGGERDESDRQEFVDRVARISAHFLAMFGHAPFERYVYLFTIPGGGGLEHVNSTAIGLMGLGGSRPGRPVVWDTVIAHEFFHAWNVKTLRPRALGPFDYTGPNRTTALWLSEGVTSYYAALAMPRIGLWSGNDYWKHLAAKFSALANDRRRSLASVADSSWQVWNGRYPIDRGRIDYYLKGECLGALLDVVIRDATENTKSLDDVMRALYEQCRKDGEGFAEDDIRLACERVAATDLHDFFARYVYGTDELPVAEIMSKAGLLVEQTQEKNRVRFTFRTDPEAKGFRRGIHDLLLGHKDQEKGR